MEFAHTGRIDLQPRTITGSQFFIIYEEKISFCNIIKIEAEKKIIYFVFIWKVHLRSLYNIINFLTFLNSIFEQHLILYSSLPGLNWTIQSQTTLF